MYSRVSQRHEYCVQGKVEEQTMVDKILIVDDERTICDTFARKLNKAGYSCVTAENGRDALHQFYRDDFSLVISDVKMPVMDGMELLRTVKSVSPKTMVIVATAYPDVGMAVEAMRLGAYDFIVKPVVLSLLLFTVRKALENRKLREELENYHKNLEKLVDERTAELLEAHRSLKRANLESVKVLIEAIDAKDTYTRGHSDRVRILSLEIAKKLGFTAQKQEDLEYGALLHDIGKIGIKDGILQKKTTLSSEEYRQIQEHSLIGVKILDNIEFFKGKLPMIRHHHERYDGKGYPDGLAGEEIPLESRIIAISDAFDAMTSARPYREAKSLEETLIEMKRNEGKQFDPHLLQIFLREELYGSLKICPTRVRPKLPQSLPHCLQEAAM